MRGDCNAFTPKTKSRPDNAPSESASACTRTQKAQKHITNAGSREEVRIRAVPHASGLFGEQNTPPPPHTPHALPPSHKGTYLPDLRWVGTRPAVVTQVSHACPPAGKGKHHSDAQQRHKSHHGLHRSRTIRVDIRLRWARDRCEGGAEPKQHARTHMWASTWSCVRGRMQTPFPHSQPHTPNTRAPNTLPGTPTWLTFITNGQLSHAVPIRSPSGSAWFALAVVLQLSQSFPTPSLSVSTAGMGANTTVCVQETRAKRDTRRQP
jgi:hypothetical protein